MKIKDSDIAKKSVAGETKDGKPIVYIQSHGGLHAVFKRGEDGSIQSIAAAPHIAIMKFLAEKKEDGIKWHEDFHKSEDLNKSEMATFNKLRGLVFSPVLEEPLSNPENLCIVYDYCQKNMQVMAKSEVLENIKTMGDRTLIRDLSMAEPPVLKSEFLSKEKK